MRLQASSAGAFTLVLCFGLAVKPELLPAAAAQGATDLGKVGVTVMVLESDVHQGLLGHLFFRDQHARFEEALTDAAPRDQISLLPTTFVRLSVLSTLSESVTTLPSLDLGCAENSRGN